MRHGECTRCGQCCTRFPYDDIPREYPDDHQFEVLHGIIRHDDGLVTIDVPCKALLNAGGSCACEIYDGRRPTICDLFPRTAEDLRGIDNCGFWFEDGGNSDEQ